MRSVVILTVLVLASSHKAYAQAPQAPPPTAESQAPYRSPTMARVLGTLIPGAGHIYAAEYARGIRYYYGSVGGIGGGALVFVVGEMATEDHETGWPLQATGVLLVGLGMSVWVRSSLDAPRAAARWNANHRPSLTHLSLVLRHAAGEQGASNLGVAVAW